MEVCKVIVKNKVSIFVSNGRGEHIINSWAQEYFDSKIDSLNTGFVGFDLSRLVPLQSTTKSLLSTLCCHSVSVFHVLSALGRNCLRLLEIPCKSSICFTLTNDGFTYIYVPLLILYKFSFVVLIFRELHFYFYSLFRNNFHVLTRCLVPGCNPLENLCLLYCNVQ